MSLTLSHVRDLCSEGITLVESKLVLPALSALSGSPALPCFSESIRDEWSSFRKASLVHPELQGYTSVSSLIREAGWEAPEGFMGALDVLSRARRMRKIRPNIPLVLALSSLVSWLREAPEDVGSLVVAALFV